jgi:hypothetical protein
VQSATNPLVYTATFTPTAGAVTGLVQVASSTFSDAAGNLNQDGSDANNALSLSIAPAPVLDTTPPTIAISSNKVELAEGETAIITFSLSEPSSNFSLSDVTVRGGTLTNFLGSGASYTATFTPFSDSLSAMLWVASAQFTDAAGNQNQDGSDVNNAVTLAMSCNCHCDDTRTPPTIAITGNTAGLNAGQFTTVTFTLSEASSDFTSADVSVVGGTLSNFQGSGTSYTATFTSFVNNAMTAVYVASDKFSNAQGEFNQDGSDVNNLFVMSFANCLDPVTATAPTVAITSNKTSLNGTESATLTFTLSEASTDFVAADVTVVGGTLSNFQGSGTYYTATFTPLANVTNASVSIGNNKLSNASGLFNVDGSDTNNALSFSVVPANPVDVFNVNMTDVLESPLQSCLGQSYLKINGDDNDVVNLSTMLDSGQSIGTWQQAGQVVVNQMGYNLWSNTSYGNALVLIDENIRTVNAV